MTVVVANELRDFGIISSTGSHVLVDRRHLALLEQLAQAVRDAAFIESGISRDACRQIGDIIEQIDQRVYSVEFSCRYDTLPWQYRRQGVNESLPHSRY